MKDEGAQQHYIGAEDAGEAERLVAQESGAQDELRAALALHLPPEQARVLELGCGNGVFTQALLTALPDATITAIDTDERLLADARVRLAQATSAGRITFARADATRLPYPARSFDLVACRFLLMHQADPLIVVGEMFRVAAIGGVALAIEPDWGARALYPDGEAQLALLDLASRAHPYGFPDLLLGRKLYALLRAVGFADMRVRATAFCETAADRPAISEDEEQPSTGPARLLEQGRSLLRSSGVADDATLDALIARLEAIHRHPEYFSAGMDFAVSARKPAPTVP